MEAIAFLFKIAVLTTVYFALISVAFWLFGRINDPALSLRRASSRIAGTHLGRLRLLCIAAVVSFVLAMVYPGSPLLFDLSGAAEPVRKGWYHLLYGSNAEQHYSPALPENAGTWFWGQAALLYAGGFVLYVVLAVPDVVQAAVRKAAQARDAKRLQLHTHGGGSGSRSFAAELIIIAIGTFLGSILAQLWGRNQSE